MQIDKQQIIDSLRQQGDQDKAQQAEGQLPEQVDTEQDAGTLQNLGINPQDLIAKFTGGGGIPGM
jgi:hypothetical protein